MKIVVNFLSLVLVAVSIFVSKDSIAFKLSPEATALERQQSKVQASSIRRMLERITGFGIQHFTEPVHEELTHRAFGCEADKEICAKVDVEYAPPAVIAGVRWNDDPPFRLTQTSVKSCKLSETIRVITQPDCWYALFRDAENRAKDPNLDPRSMTSNLMYRSHFGDLQFLHAMASKDGESAAATKRKIMLWAEFAWRVSIGDIAADIKLAQLKSPDISEFFGTSGWLVQDLFALGNPQMRKKLDEVAFGSILHMVQDSFAKGHIERADPISGRTCAQGRQEPGRVMSFRSYVNQDHHEHGEADSRAALSGHLIENPNVVHVGRELHRDWSQRKKWEEVASYFDCIFTLDNADAVAGAGAGFERK